MSARMLRTSSRSFCRRPSTMSNEPSAASSISTKSVLFHQRILWFEQNALECHGGGGVAPLSPCKVGTGLEGRCVGARRVHHAAVLERALDMAEKCGSAPADLTVTGLAKSGTVAQENPAVIEEAGECVAPLESIIHGLRDLIVAGELGPLARHP